MKADYCNWRRTISRIRRRWIAGGGNGERADARPLPAIRGGCQHIEQNKSLSMALKHYREGGTASSEKKLQIWRREEKGCSVGSKIQG